MAKAKAKTTRGPERRDDALSRERIVDAAIELLDAEGEAGLTFRALASRLATGSGAIYWHVADKRDLLVAASDTVVARALADTSASASPREAIRHVAAAVFAIIDAHPWIGTELSRAPAPTSMLLIFDRIGRQLQALRVRRAAQFTAASALVSYIIGVSRQNAATASLLDPSLAVGRTAFLETEAARWKALDPHVYPFLHDVAAQLRRHDDRAEFLAGIDLILAGIAAS